MDSDNQRPSRSLAIGLWLTIAAGTGLVLSARIFGPDYFYITEREWQTAITAWWMLAEGYGLFDAITPVMGPPWQIPMEFPLFQWLVSHATTPWLSLEDTGRALSFIFFFVSIFIVRRLALDLDLNRSVADGAAILFASSPLYLCYALSFTIESLALLLALLYLWLFVRWLLRPGLVLLMAAVLVGSVAVLAKATTWAVFAAAVSAIGAWLVFSARRHSRSIGDAVIGLVLVVGIPLACGIWWTQWSDSIKAANELTAELTSVALFRWTQEGLDHRLSVSEWGPYILRSALLVLGPIGLAAVVPAAISFFRGSRNRPPLPVLVASATALVFGPLAFTYLHFNLDYSSLSTGFFAIILLTSTLFAKKSRQWLVVVIVLSNLVVSGLYIATKQANYADPLSDALAVYAKSIPEGHTLVVLGSYLDARIPYQARRKALQTKRFEPSDPVFRDAVTLMKKEKVGAILTRSAEGIPAARWAASSLGLDSRIDLSPGVTVWTLQTQKSNALIHPLDLDSEFSSRLIGFPDSERAGRWGVLLPSGPDAALGIGLVRGGNIYLADLKRGIRVVHRRWSPLGRGG